MDELERLKKENLHLRCVMQEAAAELRAFWEYHTSDGGYGPTMLLDRLTGALPTSHESNPYPHRSKEVLNVER